jgi:hypothetical protein
VAGLEQVAGVAAQRDGGIVAVGQGDGNAVVVRFGPKGTQDTSFGSRVLAGPGESRSFGYALAVQADGKILIAGSTFGVVAVAAIGGC